MLCYVMLCCVKQLYKYMWPRGMRAYPFTRSARWVIRPCCVFGRRRSAHGSRSTAGTCGWPWTICPWSSRNSMWCARIPTKGSPRRMSMRRSRSCGASAKRASAWGLRAPGSGGASETQGVMSQKQRASKKKKPNAPHGSLSGPSMAPNRLI